MRALFLTAIVLSTLGSVGDIGIAEELHPSAEAVAQLDVFPGLQATLFASEPMLKNPTAIDIDAYGRVWVCEVVNYRRFANGDQPERTEGDRILVLEDTDQDGRADRTTTFYQGRDIDSAHGICILGARVLVSARDKILAFHDEDGDLRSDRKTTLFSGIGGVEHDHGIHTVNVGPDGKLYFNFGNEGHQIQDAHGQPIVDQAGHEVADHGHPYRQGMVFRCDRDGSHFLTLAWNFRNNWELAIDSFGGLWQSDNDDDGNRATRINFLLEYGNYGFQDEVTGAGWSTPRTHWETEVEARHWHQNDPGVVPNLLVTGAGSPTGVCVYEGNLLPEEFHGQLLHCDAGPNVVRAYPTRKSGAGYTATSVKVLDGARNPWFRPTDVRVAPDGSVLVSDWYDPGVGGHRMQDSEHGRIFRIAPSGTPYRVPAWKVNSPATAVAALGSPNEATRFLACEALRQFKDAAIPALVELWRNGSIRHRARALWLLTEIPSDPARRLEFLRLGLKDADPDLRSCAIRAARQRRDDIAWSDIAACLELHDPSPAVRREILIALRELKDGDIAETWAELATTYDSGDRWYLEALGIAAEGRWDACLAAWMRRVGDDWNTPAGRDIVWRSRGSKTSALLGKLILDPATPEFDLPRYFRAFDFQPAAEAMSAVKELVVAPPSDDPTRAGLIAVESLARCDDTLQASLIDTTEWHRSLASALRFSRGTSQFIQLVARFDAQDRFDDLIGIADADPGSQLAVEAISVLLEKNQVARIQENLLEPDEERSSRILASIGASGDPRAAEMLEKLVRDDALPDQLRRDAVKAWGTSLVGATELMRATQAGELPELLRESTAASLLGATWPEIQSRAMALFPAPGAKDASMPPLEELETRSGDPVRGATLFRGVGTCAECHLVLGAGTEVGPDLSQIGDKLSRRAAWESILFPSAGISHGYAATSLTTSTGNVLSGIVVSETSQEIRIKDAKGIVKSIPVSEIEARKLQETSLMPANLSNLMTVDELTDVVEYLLTLRRPMP